MQNQDLNPGNHGPKTTTLMLSAYTHVSAETHIKLVHITALHPASLRSPVGIPPTFLPGVGEEVVRQELKDEING